MMILNEYTRKQLINRSKSPNYNRYSNRMEVEPSDISIYRVGILELSAHSPHLDIYFIVKNNYRVSLRILNFTKKLQYLYNRSKYRNDLRKLVSITIGDCLIKSQIQVSCTCPDFYYRFSYAATKLNYGFNTNQQIPAKVRNPKNKGSACKHIIRILNAPYLWKDKIITSVISAITFDPIIMKGSD